MPVSLSYVKIDVCQENEALTETWYMAVHVCARLWLIWVGGRDECGSV